MTDLLEKPKHFIEQRIDSDLENGLYKNVITRFPPEPNGYLHIGHAKSICLNFGLAKQYHGRCHLRFDDTNPTKEEVEYMDAIKADITWLGYTWDGLYHASDYFETFYQMAITLIQNGKAYVCHLNGEQIREYRGTLTTPGKDSPYRERSVAENLDLFQRMRQGEFNEGECVLRAKIDMNSGNINLRDPIMYRILKTPHPHAGDKWCIYPMYDYAHCLSDALEKITHSICTLEFQDHRPLYDWFVEQLFPAPRPQQIEFSRLNLSHLLTSKRKLKALVDKKYVSGWNDPRMPTLAGARRRGYTPAGIRKLCDMVGVTKSDSIIDMALLEQCVRDDLNETAPRIMCVFKPLKLIIENYPEDKIEMLSAPNHPQLPAFGTRQIPFAREIYIDHDDFMLDPPAKFFRLGLNREVRLRYGYIIKCHDVVRDVQGEIVELRCTYDVDTLGKNPSDRKVKGVIHWVPANFAKTCEVRLYERLFNNPHPASADSLEDLESMLNPQSLMVLPNALIEPEMYSATPETRYQFERIGYFVIDRFDSSAQKLVFNRTVSLRDSSND